MIQPLPATPTVAINQTVTTANVSAAPASPESDFSQLVEQMVGDSVPAANLKLPLIKGSGQPPAEPLPDLPTAPSPAPLKTLDEKITTAAPSGSRRPDMRKSAGSDTPLAHPPAFAVDQPVPQIPLPPKPQLPSPGNGVDESKPLAALQPNIASRISLEPKPMLEVKIHLDPSATPVAPHVSTPSAADDAAPVHSDTPAAIQPESAQNTGGSQDQQRGSSDPAPQQPATPRVIQRAASIKDDVPPAPHPDAPSAPVNAQVPVTNGASVPATVVQTELAAPIALPKPHPSAPSAPPQPNPAPDLPKPQQPLRSMALEFTPDGANDIKVRLSERGGDVHISLHGTDPALAGRVREGVSDLVGSLSKAGYDAEAWTPSQGRQQEREQEPRQPAQQPKNNSESGEFSRILQQPTQENS